MPDRNRLPAQVLIAQVPGLQWTCAHSGMLGFSPSAAISLAASTAAIPTASRMVLRRPLPATIRPASPAKMQRR